MYYLPLLTINQLDIEHQKLTKLPLLSWAMPLMVFSTSLLDTLLMVLYQKWLHPWRRILAKVSASYYGTSVIQNDEPGDVTGVTKLF